MAARRPFAGEVVQIFLAACGNDGAFSLPCAARSYAAVAGPV